MSDNIRDLVVEALQEDKLEISGLASNLPFNLDSYKSFSEQLDRMRMPNEYAGILECLTIAVVSGRQVLIYEDKNSYYQLLARFPNSSINHTEAVHLAYQMEASSRDGHFYLLLLHDNASDYWNVSCTST